jgi:hypothetical protein
MLLDRSPASLTPTALLSTPPRIYRIRLFKWCDPRNPGR